MTTEYTPRFNPFPGLRPFGTDEDYLFFGREEQTNELLSLLRQHRFIAVVGTSGSGKSSLVRAGLLPALHGGTMTKAGSAWEVILLRPGGDPIANLARAFVDADLYDAEDEESLPRVRATLSRSSLGLVEASNAMQVEGKGSSSMSSCASWNCHGHLSDGVVGAVLGAKAIKTLHNIRWVEQKGGNCHCVLRQWLLVMHSWAYTTHLL